VIYFRRLFLYASFFCLATFGLLVYADVRGPYHGRVIDAQTKQPIEGAVVFAQWWTHAPGPTTVRLAQAYYDSQETFTDQQGNFVIPGIMHPPAAPATLDPPTFIIFKPGYEAIGGRRLKPVPPELQAYTKIKDNVYEDEGIMVVEVRRLTTQDERVKNLHKLFIPSDVPQDKHPNLYRLRCIEETNLGLRPNRLQPACY